MNLIYHKKAGLLLILFMLSIGLYGQSKKITLNYQNTQLNVVLKDIEMQVDKSFFYDGDLIKDVNTPVSISVKDASLDKIIDLLFNQELAVFETSQHLVLLKKQAVLNTANVAAVTALSQAGVAARSDVINTVRITHNLRGTVLDQDGLPLVGALVAVKGNTRKFAFADIDGKFELTDVDANSVLTITYMGYKTMEEAVGNRNTINITLAQEVNVLQDVVVTGYQSLSKERSAGAFGTIEGSGIKDKAVLSGNILSSMDGLVTGLSVNNSDGVDKFLIRGITSINSTRSPLFVVDGVPMMENIVEDLINANDIASISVLKDATAASIWGSQAGNGVVVISTKKGQRNQALKITYDGSFSFIGKPDYGYQNKMSGEMFMKNAIELFDAYSQVWDYNRVKTSNQGLGSGLPIVFPHEVPLYRHAAGEISATERDAALAQLIAQNGRHSFEDNFMSNKLFTQHSLIFNGGGEKHTYYVSVNYRGDQGSYKDWSNRIGINSYQEMQLTKWMKWDVGVNASYSNQDAQILPWRPRGQWSIYSSSQTYQRDFPYMQYGVGQDHSQYYIYQNERARYEVPSGINMEFNPVDDFNRSSYNSKATNLRVNTGLTIDLLKGLRYEGRFQYSSIHNKTEQYLPSENWLIREERLYATPMGIPQGCLVPKVGGHFTLGNDYTTDWTLRNQLIYNESFDDDKHQLTALAGTEVRSYITTGYSSFLRGYDMQTMKYTHYDIYKLSQGMMMSFFGASPVVIPANYYSQSEILKRYFSLYANGAYTYLRRYTLNASIRMDQSNLFGSDPSTQFKPIWSIGGAWRVSEESFMENQSWLNDLTLRASYGLAGNSPDPGIGGRYDLLTAVAFTGYETIGYDLTAPANNKLTWEKTRTVNIGFDIRLINHRLNLSFDYYNKKTTDLLGLMMLDPTTGWPRATGNLGTMTNKGLEISLSSHNIKGKDFNWHTNFTFSHNSNKIVELKTENPYTYSSIVNATYVEGYAANSLFAYHYAGLDNNGRPQVYDKNGNVVAGTDSFTLGIDDVKYMGTIVPKFYGGLSNRFSYKSLELSFLLVYNLGHVMRNNLNAFYSGRPTDNFHNSFDKRWRNPGDEAFTNIPKYSVLSDPSNMISLYNYADVNVLDASYVKLRDISLSWNLDRRIAQKIWAENIKLTFQIANLFYIAANKEGIDPEAYLPSFYNDNRRDKYGPTYSIGLTINF